jgi:hypothetical protein
VEEVTVQATPVLDATAEFEAMLRVVVPATAVMVKMPLKGLQLVSVAVPAIGKSGASNDPAGPVMVTVFPDPLAFRPAGFVATRLLVNQLP